MASRLPILLSIVLSVTILISAFGCRQQEVVNQSKVIDVTPNIIEVTKIFKATSDLQPPPAGDWALGSTEHDAHPPGIQQVFSQNDRMFLGIKINPQFTSTVRFSKFTYFHRESGLENQITYTPGDTGPFEPGQVVLLSFTNPFTVPNNTGTYEVRIYDGIKVVASAAFQVKTAVVGRMWVWKASDVPPTIPVPQDPPVPHPIGVQRQLSQNDSIFLIVDISHGFSQNVTFSKYTFFNVGNGQEKEIMIPDGSGPFEPGQDIFLGFTNSWAVPNEPGIYEIRIYSNDELAASAVFEVVATP